MGWKTYSWIAAGMAVLEAFVFDGSGSAWMFFWLGSGLLASMLDDLIEAIKEDR